MQDYFGFGGKNSAILFQFLASSYQINIILNFTLSMNLLIHSFHTNMHIYSLILLYCISTAAILCFKKEKEKNSSDLSKKILAVVTQKWQLFLCVEGWRHAVCVWIFVRPIDR
jgi:hypothetical protein